jgi:hypothetical protein
LADEKGAFPLVMVGGVLEANTKWDVGKEVIKCISKYFPGVLPIRPKVSIYRHLFYLLAFYVFIAGLFIFIFYDALTLLRGLVNYSFQNL